MKTFFLAEDVYVELDLSADLSLCCFFFRVQDHLSLFNGYFDDALAKQQSVSATSPSLTSNTDCEAAALVGNDDPENECTLIDTPDRSAIDDEDTLNETVSCFSRH